MTMTFSFAAIPNDAASLEAAITARQRRASPAETDAGFSAAVASAALEARAGAALEAYGGAPATTLSAARVNTQTPQSDAPSATPESKGAPPGSQTSPAPEVLAGAANHPAPLHVVQSANSTTAALAPAPTATGAQPGVAMAAPAVRAGASAPPSTAASILRPTEKAAAQNLARAASARVVAPPPEPRELAKLIAQRISQDMSSFDIRLDPPELGRVFGRLVVGDDGRASLQLTFDSVSTLEAVARAETDLRAALGDAGLSFGGGDIRFALAQPDAETTPRVAEAAAPNPVRAAARHSAGLIDLSV